MVFIPGYIIKETLEENSFFFYKANREIDNLNVIIKATWLKNKIGVEQLNHEFDLAPSLDSFYSLKPISLEITPVAEALIYEDTKCISINKYVQIKALDLNKFLSLAIEICESIKRLHNKGIIHKNINPETILINTENNSIRISDFGIASFYSSEYSPPIFTPQMIEGALPYISPEQTGQMNRNLDSRTDIYSLGVTFYFMVTGYLPFQAEDALGWVYNHIVTIPNPPHEIDPTIPEVVSNLIMKMISKLAEDRYQSMEGIKHDLEKCLTQLRENNKIIPFQLGENDFSTKFQLSQKIYGREAELNSIIESYSEAEMQGLPQVVIVSGYPGIGKTVLINEFHKPLIKKNAFFISGQFDKYKKENPYSTLIEAFKELVNTILSNTEAKIQEWKEKIIEAVGINGKIISDIIPSIELIIGRQPPLIDLPTSESKNRFNLVVENFIKVFAQKEHPLIIFLDDLQWSDKGSLQLIQKIVSNPQNEYILLLGAFRANEVNSNHPVVHTLNAIRNSNTKVKTITLHELKKEHISKFISDSLRIDINKLSELNNLVYEKTRGNPFFTIQFLISLCNENLLFFNQNTFQWDGRLKRLKKENILKMLWILWYTKSKN